MKLEIEIDEAYIYCGHKELKKMETLELEEEAERDYRPLHKQGGSKKNMKKYICQTCEKAWYSAAELRICPECHEELREEKE